MSNGATKAPVTIATMVPTPGSVCGSGSAVGDNVRTGVSVMSDSIETGALKLEDTVDRLADVIECGSISLHKLSS